MRRKSRQEHQAEGTYRPDRHGAVDPRSPRPPAKPRGLGAAQAKLWDEFSQLLADRLKPEDGPLLLMGVEWFATWQAAREVLGALEVGTLPYSRALAAVSVASQRFESIAKRLGMSPADREQLSIQPTAGGAKRW